MTQPGYPLAGLRVLDMSRVLAGPYVGRMLADLGADVVKIEPPEGDVTRFWGKVIGGLSGYFTQQNVGKRNVCIDLRKAAGPELVRDLAAKADIVVENFRPGVLAQYGLAYDQLAEINPRLVMLSISGFGQKGPEARRPAYAPVVHAETGVVDRFRHPDGGSSQDPKISLADMNAAMHGLAGVLSALYMRERTGRGQHVDIAMFDTMLAMDDHVHLALDGEPEPHGFSNDIWQAGGGEIVVAGDFRWIWSQLQEVHGVQDPTPKGADLPTKIRCRREAVATFLRSFEQPDALQVAMDKAGIAFGRVQKTADALQSPTIRHRRAVVQVDDRAGGKRGVIQSPYRFSNAQSGATGEGVARRGEHNLQVLQQWLQVDAAAVDRWADSGALLAENPPSDG